MCGHRPLLVSWGSNVVFSKMPWSRPWGYTLRIPTLDRWRQEEQEFKIILCYTAALRSASAAGDPVSTNKSKAPDVILLEPFPSGHFSVVRACDCIGQWRTVDVIPGDIQG